MPDFPRRALVYTAPVELTGADHRILDLVEPSLARSLKLYSRWRETGRTDGYRNSFALQRNFNPARRAIGFLDEAPLSFDSIPVLGVVQSPTFDYSPLTPEAAREELRGFVLRYVLRVANYKQPASFSLHDLSRAASSRRSWNHAS